MARKKQIANEPSRAQTVVAFIDRCFKDGVAMCIQSRIDETYIIDDVEYRFTETILEDMVESGKVRVTSRTEKLVNIMGVIS